MKLNSFCKSAAMQEELNDIALWSTRTVVETSRFLVLWVAKRLEAQIEAEAEAEVKIPKMDQTFFSRALKLFAGGKRKKPVLDVFGGDALNEYDEQRPIDFKEFETEHLSNAINQTAREYLTVARNHVVLNMRSRAWNHFRLFLACLDGTTTLRAADQADCAITTSAGWQRRSRSRTCKTSGGQIRTR